MNPAPTFVLALLALCVGCASSRGGSEVDQDELVDALRGGGEPWPEVREPAVEPQGRWEVRYGESPSDPYAFRSARRAREGAAMGAAVVRAPARREAPPRSGDGPSLSVEGYELVPGRCGVTPSARYELEWRSDEGELMDEVLRPRGPEPLPPGWEPESPPAREEPVPERPTTERRLIPVGSAR